MDTIRLEAGASSLRDMSLPLDPRTSRSARPHAPTLCEKFQFNPCARRPLVWITDLWEPATGELPRNSGSPVTVAAFAAAAVSASSAAAAAARQSGFTGHNAGQFRFFVLSTRLPTWAPFAAAAAAAAAAAGQSSQVEPEQCVNIGGQMGLLARSAGRAAYQISALRAADLERRMKDESGNHKCGS